MNITREQYEADIRKAKAQTLRDAANRWENDMAQHCEYRVYEVAQDLEGLADELDPS